MMQDTLILLFSAMVYTVSSIGDSIPVLVKYQPNITVKLGDTFSLPCPIELQSITTGDRHIPSDNSLKSLMITWTIRDMDENLVASDPRYQFIKMSRTIRIKNSEMSDSGTYKCRGVTGFGSQEAVFHVKILENDSCLVRQLNSYQRPCFIDSNMQSSKNKIKTIHKSVGSSVEFRCDSMANPKPNYIWFYEDSIVDHRRSVDGVRQSYLRINDVKREYKGHYTCKASNRLGKISFTFALIVKDSPSVLPKIIDEMENITLPAGSNAMLIGKIHCKCNPIIQWLQRVQPNNIDNPIGKKSRSLIALPKAASTESGESFVILDVVNRDNNIVDNNNDKKENNNNGNNGSDKESLEQSETSSDIQIENIQRPELGLVESRLKFKSLKPWHSGKYVLLTMSQQKANVNEISYKTVFLNVTTARISSSLNSKSSQSTPKIVIYISVPLGVLILCIFIIFYCLIRRRHPPSSAHSLISSTNPNQLKIKSAYTAPLHNIHHLHQQQQQFQQQQHQQQQQQQQSHLMLMNHQYSISSTPGVMTLTSSMHSTVPNGIQHSSTNNSNTTTQQQQQYLLSTTHTNNISDTIPPPPSSNSSISIHKVPNNNYQSYNSSSPTQSSIVVPNFTPSPNNFYHPYSNNNGHAHPSGHHHFHHHHHHHPHPHPHSHHPHPPPSSSSSSSLPSTHQDSHNYPQINDTFQLPPSLCFDTDPQLHSSSQFSSAPYFPGHNSSSSASLTYS